VVSADPNSAASTAFLRRRKRAGVFVSQRIIHPQRIIFTLFFHEISETGRFVADLHHLESVPLLVKRSDPPPLDTPQPQRPNHPGLIREELPEKVPSAFSDPEPLLSVRPLLARALLSPSVGVAGL